MSFTVIENSTIRELEYAFLFVFCSNYGLSLAVSEILSVV